MLQFCFDPCTEQTREDLVGALEEDKEKDAESPEAGDELSYIQAKVTKSQVVVGTAAIIAAATGYFCTKR